MFLWVIIMNVPVRKSIRLHGYDYSRNGAYFVTVCTKNKQHYFWDYTKYVGGDAHIAPSSIDVNKKSTDIPFRLTDIGNIVEQYINGICGIQKYVIMPDHIHMIIVIKNNYGNKGAMWASPPTQSVPQLMKSFKILVTKKIGFSPWQRSFNDHIIRNENEYAAYWRYIEENPANWENDDLSFHFPE